MRFWSKSKAGDKKMSTRGRPADAELNDGRNGVWRFTHFTHLHTSPVQCCLTIVLLNSATFHTTLDTFSSKTT